MIDEPNYKEKSQSDLEYILLNIDKEKYADRYMRVLEEVTLRKQSGRWVQEVRKLREPNIALRRGIAFSIDFTIISSVTSLIDNLLSFSRSHFLFPVLTFIFYFSYFFLTESPEKGASPGKRLLGLNIQSFSKNRKKSILFRTFITWFLITPFRDNLTFLIPLPGFLSLTLFALMIAFAIYNGTLALKKSGGLMLQDRLTHTSLSTKKSSVQRQNEEILPYQLRLILVIATILLPLIIYNIYIGTDFLKIPKDDSSNIVEQTIMDKYGFWATAKINKITRAKTNVEIMGSAATSSTDHVLQIVVTIPFWKYEAFDKQDLFKSVISDLKIKRGTYSKSEFVLRRSLWIFTVRETLTATFH